MRLRLLLVAMGLLLGFALLLSRSVQLQVFEQECWATLAKKQIKTILEFDPRRGDIHDRNGQELAVSIEMDSLAANPRVVEDPKAVARQLASITGISESTLLGKLHQRRAFVWLKHHVPPRQADAIRALGLRGIHFVTESRRYYPNGELAGHLLGFVGREHHGLEGLELSQNLLLSGRSDTQPGTRDARGQIIYTHGLPDAENPQGHSLRLTLDKRIQYITTKELQQTVERFEAKSGIAVVMEPATGEILALTLFPSFNPNTFTSYHPSAWRNRAVTDAFEPGSTFKIFLAAAALEEALAQPEDLFYCEQGNYRVQNHTIHDIHKYGWLSLAQIIQLSSNIGAAKVGEKLGAKRFHHYIRAFGFGEPTGIGLPGETSGVIRPPEEWSAVDLAAASFGQSLSVSAVQMAMAVGAVANDGLLVKPLLIKEVLDDRGQVVRKNKPQVVRRVISVATAKRLKQLLADVLTPEGTGARAALAHYRAAGKTGTAQKSSRTFRGYSPSRYTASFIGFVPVEDPKIAVVIIINEPGKGHYGGVVAAPAFRRIAEQTLYCLNVPPEKMEKTAAPDTGRQEARRSTALQPVAYAPADNDRPLLMPDLSGLSLRAALDQLRTLPCSLDIRGSGRVVGQSPEPGSDLTKVSWCRLILAED